MTVNEFYFSEWLREATQDLCEDACERVTQEIRSHYVDRVGAELALGRDDDEAHARAMAGLGSPNVARRAYNRTCLTKGYGCSSSFRFRPSCSARQAGIAARFRTRKPMKTTSPTLSSFI